MKYRTICLCCIILAATALAACSSDSSSDTPDAQTDTQADTPSDGFSKTDVQKPDSATDSAPDSDGKEDANVDATEVGADDGGGEDVSHDGEPDDSSNDAPLEDAKPDVESDVMPDVKPDGGPEGHNVIANPGFEFWSDGLPDSWMGEATQLMAGSVKDNTSAPHGGAHACELINSSSETHRRFSSAASDLKQGRYDCSYWAKGKGEVRTTVYDGDKYKTYSSYTTVGADWKQIKWDFNLTTDVANFEFVFSVRATDDNAGVQLDDVYCERRPEACDSVTCPDWAECDRTTATCKPKSGRCELDTHCRAWEKCDDSNTCVLQAGKCNETADCPYPSATPLCDKVSHTCVAGDPCGGVVCDEWKQCDPNTAKCILKEGRCNTTLDCTKALPACNGATRTCESADHACNIVANGGFESWNMYNIPYEGDHLMADHWYGLDIPGSSEIDPARVLQYSTAPHTGKFAVQLIQDGIAERFTSEVFDVPTGYFTCVYWVRGKGQIRHRTYSSGGWSPYTDRETIDSLVWAQIPFSIFTNVRDMRIIFYASYTDAAKDHIQIDDVVCTKNP